MSKPQPIPYIGPDFHRSEHRLMFVGIETYSNWPPRKDCKKTNYSEFDTALVKSMFFKEPISKDKTKNRPFWNWVNTISTEVTSPKKDAQEAFRRIAYSNLHKCQVRKDATEKDFDESSYQLDETSFRNCIEKAGWIYKEIQELGAKNIVVFSGHKNENFLARIFLRYNGNRALKAFDYSNPRVKPEEHTRFSKRDDLFVHLKDGSRRFIITNHPQGTPGPLREEIVRIIRENDWSTAEAWEMPSS